MKKIKKIIVSIMLVFVLGTGMNITSTFNTVDVRAASVEKTEAVEILQGLIDEGGNASTTKDDIKYTLSADAENFKFVIEPEVEQ